MTHACCPLCQTYGKGSRPFFLHVGWTLPHGPDAGWSMREKALPYTPDGTWKLNMGLEKASMNTRREVRERVPTMRAGHATGRIGNGRGGAAPTSSAAREASGGSGRRLQQSESAESGSAGAVISDGRYPEGHAGHKDYGLGLMWMDRGVGTVLWALQVHAPCGVCIQYAHAACARH